MKWALYTLVVGFLISATPVRAASIEALSDEQLGQMYVEVLKTFDEMTPAEKSVFLRELFPEAYAIDKSDAVCIAEGGYSGHGSYWDCKPDEVPASCPSGEYACNPEYYGKADGGATICLNSASVGRYKTRACSNHFLAMAGVAPPIYRSDFSNEDYTKIASRIKNQKINTDKMASSLKAACSYHHAPSCYKTIQLFSSAATGKCALPVPSITTQTNEIIKNMKRRDQGYTYDDRTVAYLKPPGGRRTVDDLIDQHREAGDRRLQTGRKRDYSIGSLDQSKKVPSLVRNGQEEAYRYYSQVDGDRARLEC